MSFLITYSCIEETKVYHYAWNVVERNIIACEDVFNCYNRFLNDIEKSESIDNSDNYLFCNSLENSRYFTQISFRAPSKPGKYELWAVMAKNPRNFQDNPLNFRRRSLDYSHRITLIVE